MYCYSIWFLPCFIESGHTPLSKIYNHDAPIRRGWALTRQLALRSRGPRRSGERGGARVEGGAEWVEGARVVGGRGISRPGGRGGAIFAGGGGGARNGGRPLAAQMKFLGGRGARIASTGERGDNVRFALVLEGV